MKFSSPFLATVLVTSSALMAQSRGGSGVGTTSTGRGTTTTNSPYSSGTDGTSGVQDLQQRPLYLSGKVILDDGTPASHDTIIQLVCFANPRNLGYADGKGHFNVNVNGGGSMARLTDASQNSGYGLGNGTVATTRAQSVANGSTQSGSNSRELMGCELQASLAGYKSDHLSLANRTALDNPEVGSIVLHRLAKADGLTVSTSTLLAPPDAKKAYEKGRNAESKDKWADAEKHFSKAVDDYPKFAAAWYELGYSQERLNNTEAARQSYKQALATDSHLLNSYERMMFIAVREAKWQEAAENSSKLISLNATEYPNAYYCAALAYLQLKDLNAAERSAREGLKTDSTHQIPRLNHVLGVILAQKRQYAAAADSMRAYLAVAPTATDAEMVKRQLAEIEKLGDRDKN